MKLLKIFSLVLLILNISLFAKNITEYKRMLFNVVETLDIKKFRQLLNEICPLDMHTKSTLMESLRSKKIVSLKESEINVAKNIDPSTPEIAHWTGAVVAWGCVGASLFFKMDRLITYGALACTAYCLSAYFILMYQRKYGKEIIETTMATERNTIDTMIRMLAQHPECE